MKQASVSSIDQGGGNLHRRENNICVIELCGFPEPPTSTRSDGSLCKPSPPCQFQSLVNKVDLCVRHSMTVADCFALCVLVALFVGAAAFWIAQGKFWTNDAKNAPERAETSANATLLADERNSDLSG